MQGEEVPFLRSMQKSHTRLAKLFHWGFIILYSYGLLKQLNDVSDLEDSRLLTFEVAFASLFLFIVLMRYFYMSNFETFLGARQPVPPLHKYLARMIHISMYVCMFGVTATHRFSDCRFICTRIQGRAHAKCRGFLA